MSGCFSPRCDCCCGALPPEFDEILQRETRFPWTLAQLCCSNILWFVEDAGPTERDCSGVEGVYLLWHKDGWCATHELNHMRSLYVGKGRFYPRMYDHWRTKDFSREQSVYWTLVEMPNRQAKYVEQLLLDLFDFPFNKAECRGMSRLCMHLSPEEVD